MQVSIVNSLSIIIVFQLTLLIIYLLRVRRGKRISNRLLALFFFLLLINIVDGLLTYYGFYTQYPRLAHFEDGCVFLLGPVAYFYTRSIVYRTIAWQRKDWLHLLLFLLTTIAYQLFYQLQPDEYRQMVQRAVQQQELPPGFYFSIIAIYIHIGIYLYASFQLVSLLKKEMQNHFSSLAKVNFSWLTYLLWSIVATMLISLVYTFLPVMGLHGFFTAGMSVTLIGLFGFISGVLWKALEQPELFSGLDREEVKRTVTVSDQEQQQIRVKLERVMNEQEAFLNSELSVDALADLLGVSPRKVSQCINETYGQTFFEFVNQKRIEKAKKIFDSSSDSRITVLEVMYQCGFNSKSSFNTIFKAATGMTPSEYKRRSGVAK